VKCGAVTIFNAMTARIIEEFRFLIEIREDECHEWDYKYNKICKSAAFLAMRANSGKPDSQFKEYKLSTFNNARVKCIEMVRSCNECFSKNPAFELTFLNGGGEINVMEIEYVKNVEILNLEQLSMSLMSQCPDYIHAPHLKNEFYAEHYFKSHKLWEVITKDEEEKKIKEEEKEWNELTEKASM